MGCGGCASETAEDYGIYLACIDLSSLSAPESSDSLSSDLEKDEKDPVPLVDRFLKLIHTTDWLHASRKLASASWR